MPATFLAWLVRQVQECVAQEGQESQWNPGDNVNPEVIRNHYLHCLLIEHK
jgi:hypothetical protein